MNIGLAIYNFDPSKGGAERYAYDLASDLIKRGHQVYVFCAKTSGLPGATVARFDTARFPRWLRSLSFALNHRMHMRSFPIDVMLGFGNTLVLDVYQSHGGVQRVWMEREIASYDDPRERRVKAVLLRNSLNQRVQRWIEENPIRNKTFSRIVAISDMLKGHMSAHYGLREDAIDVVYNGVDTERFRPAETKPDGPLKILFSAGNFRLKGLHPLLLALGEIARDRRDFELLIMGRGRKERYSDLIDDLGIRDLVTFLGETSTPDEVYRDAHICAHPTFYDACSLTTMEAMASGLPTITTKWNGASALVGPGEGYVIDDASNTAALVTAVRALFHPDKRNWMGEKSRRKIETYTIERNVDQLENIFREVCDARSQH